jgi:mono/diheme cytochrome c family protein
MKLVLRIVSTVVIGASLLAFFTQSGPASARTEAQRLKSGQEVFLASCAVCHGSSGAGDGPLAMDLLKEAGTGPPRLDDRARLQQLGREGVRRIIVGGGGHAGRSNLMPAWGEKLDARQADDVTDYVMNLPNTQNPALASAKRAYLSSPPGSPVHGRELFVFYCSACHGPEGKGNGPYASVLRSKHKVYPRNLTQTAYFTGKSDEDLYLAVSLGGVHKSKVTFMPAWSATLKPDQIKDLVSYVRVLSKTAPKP